MDTKRSNTRPAVNTADTAAARQGSRGAAGLLPGLADGVAANGAAREGSLALSATMLKAVLDGHGYETISGRWRVSRSAVEQRVKRLARALQEAAGLPRESPSIRVLRAHRQAYLDALARHRPQTPICRQQRRGLKADDIEQLLEAARCSSACPQRDVALLLVLFATAARPLEIARLIVADYLRKDGTVREESVLRAQAAVNGKERPLYFASARLVAALDAYLLERLRHGHGLGIPRAYRGLDPASQLFLTEAGKPLPISVRGRRHLCLAILHIYRRLFARAGLPGVSAMSARRTVAQRLAERGCAPEQIATVLGLKDRAGVRRLVAQSRPAIKAAVKELV